MLGSSLRRCQGRHRRPTSVSALTPAFRVVCTLIESACSTLPLNNHGRGPQRARPYAYRRGARAGGRCRDEQDLAQVVATIVDSGSRRRRESSEGRLGPLLNHQPTATIPPNPATQLGGPRL